MSIVDFIPNAEAIKTGILIIAVAFGVGTGLGGTLFSRGDISEKDVKEIVTEKISVEVQRANRENEILNERISDLKRVLSGLEDKLSRVEKNQVLLLEHFNIQRGR